jgi:hypothetical protein
MPLEVYLYRPRPQPQLEFLIPWNQISLPFFYATNPLFPPHQRDNDSFPISFHLIKNEYAAHFVRSMQNTLGGTALIAHFVLLSVAEFRVRKLL